jgi:acetyltransferase-like isoleucine patch superfamily enzyme
MSTITKAVKSLLQLSLLKTVFFNLKWFGARGVKLPVLIARKCRIRVKGKVQLSRYGFGTVKLGFGGSPAVIEKPYSRFAIKKGAVLIFEGKAGLSAGNSVCVDGGICRIGNGFSTNKNCFIACSKGMTIGDDVTLGWDVKIRDNDGHTIIDQTTGVRSESKEVRIGSHVWLCAYTDVLKGSVIPDESVVAYGSLVTKAFEKTNSLIGGSPAKVLKENIGWEY